MPRLIDLTGREVGWLTVIHRQGRASGNTTWLCRCRCGRDHVAYASDLKRATIKSCGCRPNPGPGFGPANGSYKHGRSGTDEWVVWYNMRSRCYNPDHEAFPDYGGRGITVCERWQNSFSDFYADMGPRPGPKLTLDRIDNNGPYSPENCRWATWVQQQGNRRSNRLISHGGETLPIASWARRIGISRGTLRYRLDHGWPIDRALTTAVMHQ